jgi:Na+/phosphate symporter
MCEILFIIYLARKVAKIANDKGRNGFGYGFMLVGLWIGGEIAGALVGVSLVHGQLHNNQAGLAIYACMLAGAAAGAILTFIIVSSLSPIDVQQKIMQEYLGNRHYDNRETQPGNYPHLDDAFRERSARDLDDRFR